MFRKTALALAMVGAAASQNALALGLGDISLDSALNQPLKAEISLLSATDEELQGLKVGIAPADAFEKAGVDRPIFLTKLKFSVDRAADGSPVIRVTSRDAIREPFLDFLVQVVWANGKMLREYTVLVDPPVTMPGQAPVTAAPVAAAPAPAPAPTTSRRVLPVPSAPVPAADVGRYDGDTYGPTGRNDTLWTIAEQVRPDGGVSMEQTMLGLLNANPEAFFKHNVNNLKAGYILRVPSREQFASVSQEDALAEVRVQNQEWREGRERPALASGAPVPAPRGTLELMAAEGDPDSGGGVAGEAADLGTLRKELVLASEAAEVQRQQTEDLEGRLVALETQLSQMQRLIELKDDQLAMLKDQVGEEAVAAMDLPEEPEAVVAEEPAPADEAAVDEAADETATDAAGEMVAEPGEEMAAGEETVVEEAAPAVEAEAPVIAEEPVVAEPEPFKESQSLLDRVMANPVYLAIGGGVLALFGLLFLRRRKAGQDDFQESILQERTPKPASASAPVVEEAADQAAEAADEAVVAAATSGGESSLLSEFATSDLGSIQNQSEADPLAEADVYLAYGRYQQAEDLIKAALEREPEGEELNLKLFEIYAAAQNRAGFDAHAQQVLGQLENTEAPLWEKVAEMGRDLSPDNPLYQPGGAAAAPAEAAPAGGDAGMDSGSLESEAEAKAEDEGGLDFDLDLGLGSTEETPDFAEEAETTIEQADEAFDLNEGLESVAETTETAKSAESNEMEFDLGDLNLDSDLTGSEGAPAEEEEEAGDGVLADVDEVGTKLDLARAYIDMGDPDGARSILDEVMEEGNDDQKGEAQELFAQL